LKCFEYAIVTSSMSLDGGPYIQDEDVMFAIPDEAEEMLEPILEPYGQDPAWYFMKLPFSKETAPWAIACLDREYDIAEHIRSHRPEGTDILFTQYTQTPNPIPDGFVPMVGSIAIRNKKALLKASEDSSVFQKILHGLENCDGQSKWLILVDPLELE